MTEQRTVFKRVDYTLDGLLHYIDIGDIGLPDIQRPFVWTPVQVRDLFDSMYKGFPVGNLLFWSNAEVSNIKQIGTESKEHKIPNLLVVDGQQRLTSLYAVFRGKSVINNRFREVKIEIAFRPLDGKFEVTDATVKRNPDFISNISDVWSSNKSSYRVVKDFLANLESKRALSEDEKELISKNLDKLFDLQKYPFSALEISPTVDEEQVSDIFVRINSKMVKLNQADFILTLLSVFWEEGRRDLENFCRDSYKPPTTGSKPSSFNHFIEPQPDQLLRVAIAFGFGRGVLKSVYQLLRGKDVDTEMYLPDKRDEQFAKLKEAQAKVLDLTNWHQFLNSLVGAGFRSYELISSENTMLYSYAIYLLGKYKFQIQENELQRLVGRWFFASSVSGRYTSSPESTMDGDLNRVKNLDSAEDFKNTLNKIIGDTLTNDFWDITVPNELETSSTSNPLALAFYASQNKLGAPVLFSTKRVSELLDPTIRSKKKNLEKHHLFPNGWLQSQGIEERTIINQVANFTYLEWPDNISVSDDPPGEYVPKMRQRFDEPTWNTMNELHALPAGWENMTYADFLLVRRRLMAGIIRRGFEAL